MYIQNIPAKKASVLITPETLEKSGWKKKCETNQNGLEIKYHTWTRWVARNGKNRRIIQRITFYCENNKPTMVEIALREKLGSTISFSYYATEFSEENLDCSLLCIARDYNIRFR